MAYRLALQLGFASADHLLDQLSPTQWLEWIEYARLEPFGVQHRDRVLAQMIGMLAQFHHFSVDVNQLHESFGHRKPPAPKLTLEEERRKVEADAMLFSMQLHGGS